ncbi:MAG: hypothetical protein M3Z04_19420 [Chloroflexota bacterium]|nr:hypothetical protein [Chloroflexota bacterium]
MPRLFRSRLRLLCVVLLALTCSGQGPRPARAAPPADPVIFGEGLLPATDSTVPAGQVTLGCTVGGSLPLTSYSLLLDDVAVPTTISSDGPPWQLRATVQVRAGAHRAGALTTDTAGASSGWAWSFSVTGSAPPTVVPPTAAPPRPTVAPPTPTSLPTPRLDPTIRPLGPPDGWLVPSGVERLAALFSNGNGPDGSLQKATMTLDGTNLVLKFGGADSGGKIEYYIDTPISPGAHRVQAQAINNFGRSTQVEWNFLAADPIGDADLSVLPLSPQPGLTLPSGAGVRLAARLQAKANLGPSTMLVDGREVTAEGGGPDAHQETLFAEAARLTAGRHTVRVQGSDSTGRTRAVVWDFYIGSPAAGEARDYYPPTGFSVTGPFRSYWAGLGPSALQVLGYPISGLLVERLPDGHAYTVQYFERVRLEWHPENRGTEFEVLYGLLGTAFHQPDPAIPVPVIRPGQQYFAPTGHLVRGAFLQKWQTTGGLRVHGYPISEEIQEVSPTDGHAYLVQYFQRARFEYHPENAGSPYEILLGVLGRQLYTHQYPER